MSRRASMPRVGGATLLAAACALASCAKTSNSKPSVRISTQTESRAAATMAPYGGLICATFELQPFQLLPDGTPDTSGQTPVIIHSTPTASTTDSILGCIDGPGYMGNNWGYVVTAHDFGDCTTWTNPDGTLGSSGTPDPTHPNGEPIPGLSPLSVQFEQAFECKAGVDNALDLTANVSVAESDGAGYVDITAGVDSTLVMVGCKTADFGVADGLLHFGETGFYDPTLIPAPYGLTGIGYIDSTRARSLRRPAPSPSSPGLSTT